MAEWLALGCILLFLTAVWWSTARLFRTRTPSVKYRLAGGVQVGLWLTAAATLLLTMVHEAPRMGSAPPPAYEEHFLGPGGARDFLSQMKRPPSPPPASSDPVQMVRDQIAQVVPGLILFNPPETMRVGRKEPVTVRISRAGMEQALRAGIAGRGVPQIEKIEVGTFMRVRLSGDGFVVTAKSDESQIVPEDQVAEWLFDVIPDRAGDRTLLLLVAVRFKLQGSEELRDLPVLTRQIKVEVNPWWNLTQFLTENWQWLLSGLGTVLSGLLIYFVKRWWEARHKTASEPEIDLSED